MLSLAHLRTLFTASFIALVIVACGGGSSGEAEPLADDPTDIQPVSEEVLGDDVDADGIRDDVQMMIESEFGGDLEVMRAFTRMAVIDREAFRLAHDHDQLQMLANEHRLLLHCWFKSFDTYPERMAAIRIYRKTVFDTAERIARGLLMDGRLNGMASGSSLPDISECP